MSGSLVPRWMWRASVGLYVGVIVALISIGGVTLSGATDPKPIGMLIDQLTEPINIEISDINNVLFIDADLTIDPPGSVELSARHLDGSTATGYGLWIGSPDSRFATAINSNGYLTLFTESSLVWDWQPYPHVRPRNELNRIRFDIETDTVVVRLNDEIVASVEQATEENIPVGFYVETFDAGGSTIIFEALKIWQVQPSN